MPTTKSAMDGSLARRLHSESRRNVSNAVRGRLRSSSAEATAPERVLDRMRQRIVAARVGVAHGSGRPSRTAVPDGSSVWGISGALGRCSGI